MRLLVLAALLCYSLCLLPGCNGKQSVGLPPCDITAPFDSLFGNTFSSSDAPGAFVTVMRGDTVVYSQGFGLARLDTQEPMTDSTMFNVCSATKTFVVAALMKLVEDGKLSLDQPLSDFFPQLRKDVFSRITVRHVLIHSTGLPDLRPSNEKEWQEYVRKHPDTQFTQLDDYILYARGEELTRFFGKLDTLNYEPGSRFEYLNPPYVLLSQVIESVTGVPFLKWMRDNVFDPAGLTEIEFYIPARADGFYSHGYVPSTGKNDKKQYVTSSGMWKEYDYGEAPFFATRADQGLMVTPREFLHWLRALYGGKVIGQASLDTANTVQISTPLKNLNIHYGLGLFIQTGPDIPKKVFHSTSNGGYAIFEGVFPDRNLFYMIFANRSDWNRLELARKADSIFMAEGWLDPLPVRTGSR